jgi:hypothetical protein
LALLQVGLPVQVARVDVTQPAGVARPQQQDIGWHHFVVREMDQIADSHLFPQDLLVARRFALIDPARGVVDPLVAGVPPPVLEQILHSRHSEHEHHRYHGDLLSERVNRGKPVEQHDQNKIQIRYSMKLF